MADPDPPRPLPSWASSRRDPTVFYRQSPTLEGGPNPGHLPTPQIRPRTRRRRTVRVTRLRSEYVRDSHSGYPRLPRQSRHRHGESSTRRSRSSSRQRPTLVDVARSLATYWVEEKGRLDESQPMRPMSMVAMRPPAASSDGTSGGRNRQQRHVYGGRPPNPTAATTQIMPLQKPVASSSSVLCSIILAEPNVYLSGFDHDNCARRNDHPVGTALLRGRLQLAVFKKVKIKAVQLKLVGKTRTEWPEGIPPMRMHEWEEDSLRTQVLTFFNAAYDGWETQYGNQCFFSLTENPTSAQAPTSTEAASVPFSVAFDSLPRNPGGGSRRSRASGSRELKRLGLRSVRTRSFGQVDTPTMIEKVAPNRKGYKVFEAGTYEYSFELPIDHHQLETTRLPFGWVKWELQATVERAGAFRPNLHGAKEVSVVRLPDQMSLEATEPISISRQWDDQLHYDIVVSGKSFAVGSKIPIAFKFTPLGKVQVYKIRVFLAETIEYYTNDRRVTRREPGRKMLLMEKTAGRPLDPQFRGDLRTTSGGERPAHERRSAREASRRSRGEGSGHDRESLGNLLGDLDLGVENFWVPTEIEANVQIPTCEMMRRDTNLTLHPDSSWKNVAVDHCIKIVMRVSRPDPEDPVNRKRRHFEISIDSPITLLNCRATQANTSLPQYSGSDRTRPAPAQRVCGCPDAAALSSREDATLTTVQRGFLPSEPPLPGARRARPYSAIEPAEYGRPIHLIRRPSFNPPAFDAEEPPPPAGDAPDMLDSASILTPPPRYDAIVGTPSVDGMADYFARYSARHPVGTTTNSASARTPITEESDDVAVEDDDDDDDDDDESDGEATTLGRVGRPRLMERTGRVNVANPRTPGGMSVPSRSLEIERPAFVLAEPPLGRNRV